MLLDGITAVNIRDDLKSDQFAALRIGLFTANGTISAGQAVMRDTSGTAYATKVIAATTADDHAIMGIYNGHGGSGAVNAVQTPYVSSTAGAVVQDMRAAAAGDTISVVRSGITKGLAAAASATGTTGSAIATNDALGASLVAGVFHKIADPGAGILAPFVAMQAIAFTSSTDLVASLNQGTLMIDISVSCL